MPTAEKTAAIEQLKETFDSAAAIFLADFTGLNVEKMTDLRRKCRANGVQFSIVKNTLAIKATQALELSDLEPHFRGPTALASSTEDPTSPARVLLDFQKEHQLPQVKLGYVDGQVLSADQVKALADLPSRDVLISQVMQLAMGPVQNLVYCLNDSMSKLVRTVDAVRDGMEKGTLASGTADAGTEAAAEPAAEAPAEEAEAEAKDAGEPAADAPAEAAGDDAGEAADEK
ncbi:50S ribosomal protein L10 [bacterium]|nr:50S ribosomal protein L10 [bacterium]